MKVPRDVFNDEELGDPLEDYFREFVSPGGKADFHPDSSPSSFENRAAAECRGLHYDKTREVYVDAGGMPVYDRRGNLLKGR